MRDWELGLNVDIVWSGLYVDGKSTGKLWFEHLSLKFTYKRFSNDVKYIKGQFERCISRLKCADYFCLGGQSIVSYR